MISDVILDALEEIERYQLEMHDIYARDFERIERLKLDMKLLVRSLVSPASLKKDEFAYKNVSR
jgi:hypothetical protein